MLLFEIGPSGNKKKSSTISCKSDGKVSIRDTIQNTHCSSKARYISKSCPLFLYFPIPVRAFKVSFFTIGKATSRNASVRLFISISSDANFDNL